MTRPLPLQVTKAAGCHHHLWLQCDGAKVTAMASEDSPGKMLDLQGLLVAIKSGHVKKDLSHAHKLFQDLSWMQVMPRKQR